jgi:hypothetical protein
MQFAYEKKMFKINEVAEEFNVNPNVLRFYEKKKLLIQREMIMVIECIQLRTYFSSNRFYYIEKWAFPLVIYQGCLRMMASLLKCFLGSTVS